ncbi:S41 family peptidase [Kordiimonas aestuarii]|uniref:S41 family peptidase n=1 Tax=Kordiimonas aestuarii TaxID=1005925 RepID=UPI0021D11DFE|nr:S41 family peptidase [Kordiimonas aestuarii]
MARIPSFFILVAACLTNACSEPHLDIFPPLEDPALMSTKLPAEKLREDVDAFYFGALERHPSLGEYADHAALKAAVAEIKAGLDEPLTRLEFFRHVGKLTHKFGDGHSMLLWPYPEYEAMKDAGTKPFPFDVYIDRQDQLLIREAYSNKEGGRIAAGSRIVSIGGIPATELTANLQRYVGGETEYLRKQFLADRFFIYAWAVYGIVGDVEMELETEAGTVTVAVSNTEDWQAAGADADADKDFYYRTLPDGTAFLHVGHFDVDPGWFEDFADEAFAAFRDAGATSLVIDVRENTGGNTDTALYLARYVADKPFRMVSKMREKLNRDNRGIMDHKGAVGAIINTEWDDWIDPMSDDKRLKGDTYLLISPITYSSGIVFASVLKDFGFATLIGQETGGNANQTAQGNLFNLPHSELRAYIATRMLVRPSGSVAPGGVKPDHNVEPTQESLRAGRDVEMEKALALIAKKS